MQGYNSAFLFSQVPYARIGSLKSGLTSLSAASGETGEVTDVSEELRGGKGNPEPTQETPECTVVPAGNAAPERKRKIRSKLLSSKSLWAPVRTKVTDQVREVGAKIEYQLTLVHVGVKLFTRTVVIETVRLSDNAKTIRSFPIASDHMNQDLKSYIDSLCAFEGWLFIANEIQFQTGLTSHRYPLTIAIITLPIRLPGFNLDVIRRMLADIDCLISINTGPETAFQTLEDRIALADVTTHINGGKTVFLVGEHAISNVFTKQLRSILNSLSSDQRPNNRTLNLIKVYLHILRTALSLLDRLHNNE